MKPTEHRRTRHFNIMLVAFAIVGLVAALAAIYPDARASQERHGWWRHGGGGHTGVRICEEGALGRTGDM